MSASDPRYRFGKYTFISRLGMGGMAEVFKAELNAKPDVQVAIKRILPQFGHDKKLIGMLVNEARLSMGLSHPNIVPVLDFGIVDGNYFIAMEYVRGKDLKSIMIRCKTRGADLPIQMSIFIAIQVLRALEYAHRRTDQFDRPLHLVHRDISPQNVMVSLWGEVKILDFGIAKAARHDPDTQTGILKGKFSYMSPEQARGRELDHRTDIYSTGVVLWEMLTLESYLEAETDLKLLARVREGKFRRPSSVNPKVPAHLDAILRNALRKKPGRRYPSAEEFAADLESFQRETIGQVTEADLAAFVRALFGIPAREIEGGPDRKVGRDLIAAGIERALAETVAEEARQVPSRVSSFRRQARAFRVPGRLWKGMAAVAAAGALLAVAQRFPPRRLLRAFDRQVIRLAAALHRYREPAGRPAVKAPQFHIPPLPEPAYALRFSPRALSQLDELPFDTFERMRDRAADLAFEPRPAGARADPSRPGSWSVSQADRRIRYSIDDALRVVTVETIGNE